MRLLAISDLHVRYPANRALVEALPAHPEDWLILCGDLGESEDDLHWVFSTLGPRYAQLIWVPGNHELWTLPRTGAEIRGEARYAALVRLCRDHGVLTPEDPYPRWPGAGPQTVLAPLFLGYDYSFRPDDVPADQARAWAREAGLICTDEAVLHPDPYPDKVAWCHARVRAAEARLDAIPGDCATVLINHYPLLREHAVLPLVPRFSIWCGTRLTEDWHRRYRASVVVFGHLHIRKTRWKDGTRFEEVSLGYPRQYTPGDPGQFLRVILP